VYDAAMKSILQVLTALLLCFFANFAGAQQAPKEYVLGAGDVIRVTVFQNPDLTTESRVSETGGISFPLVGTVPVGGLSLPGAEQKIAQMLKDGGFVTKAQVTILLTQIRGSQVAVLGQVNRPGRFPLETSNTRLSDMLATAGGIAATGADTVIVTGVRDGKPFRREVDIAKMYLQGDLSADIPLQGGDALYVHRAPVFYIYGEVQRPGSFRLERNMTVMQALASGGGITLRGTLRGMQINRRDASGKPEAVRPSLDDLLQPDDVIYVRESMF
jgi:polysaccharide export outer membrane protein